MMSLVKGLRASKSVLQFVCLPPQNHKKRKNWDMIGLGHYERSFMSGVVSCN